MNDQPRYKIVRYFYRSETKRTIRRRLTLEEAQAHCGDPETSSKGRGYKARSITARYGPWFDGYEHE